MSKGATIAKVLASAALPGGVAIAGYFAWKFWAGREDDDAGLKYSLKGIVAGSGDVEAVTAMVGDSPALTYVREIAASAAKYTLPPALILAIGDHESQWGNALDPAGAGGVGDHTVREFAPGTAFRRSFQKYVIHTSDVNGDKDVLNPPYWPEIDAHGFGLGLMQIDAYYNDVWAFRKAGNLYLWQIPGENIDKGCSKIRAALDAFDDDVTPAIAAYNAGIDAVRAVIAKGVDPDVATGANHYVAHVTGRLHAFGSSIEELEAA